MKYHSKYSSILFEDNIILLMRKEESFKSQIRSENTQLLILSPEMIENNIQLQNWEQFEKNQNNFCFDLEHYSNIPLKSSISHEKQMNIESKLTNYKNEQQFTNAKLNTKENIKDKHQLDYVQDIEYNRQQNNNKCVFEKRIEQINECNIQQQILQQRQQLFISQTYPIHIPIQSNHNIHQIYQNDQQKKYKSNIHLSRPQSCQLRSNFEQRQQSNRKNTCLKKKTITIKDFSQVSIIDDDNISKSYKKVVFKRNEKQNNKIDKQQIQKQNKQNRNKSITSIYLSQKNNIKQSNIKNFKIIYDLGNNNIIYRYRSKGIEQLAQLHTQITLIQDQQRQYQIFNLIRNLQHNNIHKYYNLSKIISDQKTILIHNFDFYPKNLEQFLIDLKQKQSIHSNQKLQCKKILYQILQGIYYLHSHQISHRNIQPSNILIDHNLKPVITNFSSISSPSLKNKSILKCNWFYRPPQVILQSSHINGYSIDIWQFGCLAVYMFNLKMPFQEYSDADLIIEMMRVLGNISSQDRILLGLKGNKKFVFPDLRKSSMSKKFDCNDLQLLDILQRIFIFNPEYRITIQQLLKHKYFQQYNK